MKLLAFETSSAQLSVALWRDGEVQSRVHLDAAGGSSNSELLLPTMHQLLASQNTALKELDVIAFGQGPGAFTGVRIACGVAQGLAFGLGIPLIALPSTLALAERAAAACLVAIDARMNEVYLAAYARAADQPSGWRTLIEPVLCGTTTFPTLLGERVIGIGSAFDHPVMGASLRSHYAQQLDGVVMSAYPDAASLACLAGRLHARLGPACTIHPRDAAPLYLRNRVALTIDERAAQKADKLAAANTR